MRVLYVERDFEKPEEWNVYNDETDWLATFKNEADARDWADLQALRP